MNTVDIKVNVFERLKKIRQGVVYGDITSVVGEFIQNCQRSLNKSDKENKVIDVIINEKALIIRDNGIGCDDPQTIFEFETSGWGLDHAFGQGGSESVFQIADVFEIYSHNWKVRCNVNSILKSKRLKVQPKQAKYFDGYQLTVKGEFITKNYIQLMEYLKDMLSHLKYTCFINGERVQYVDIQDFPTDGFKMKFDNEYYSGTLATQRASKYIQIFFEKRKVKDIWQSSSFGVIELKDGAVDLKAPDRKDIIYNTKYWGFSQQLTIDTITLYKEAVKTFNDTDFEYYSSEILDLLKPEDYVKYLPYTDVIGERDAIIRVLGLENKVETAKVSEKTEPTFSTTPGIPAKEEITDTKEVLNINDGFSVVSKDGAAKNEEKFTEKVKTAVNAVWVEIGRTKEFEKELRLAESYGLKILYAKNRLYEEAYKYLKKVHISDFIAKSEEVYVVQEAQEYRAPSSSIMEEAISKEERILKVLKLIERNYELGDTFSIGTVEKKLRLGDINTKASKASVAVFKKEGKIVFDRESLVLDCFDLETSYDAITRFDILVVMANIQAIAGGLSQLMLNTIPDTVEHYNSVQRFTKELAILLNNTIAL